MGGLVGNMLIQFLALTLPITPVTSSAKYVMLDVNTVPRALQLATNAKTTIFYWMTELFAPQPLTVPFAQEYLTAALHAINYVELITAQLISISPYIAQATQTILQLLTLNTCFLRKLLLLL